MQARQVAEFGLQLSPIAGQTRLGLPLFALHGGKRPQFLAIHLCEGFTIESGLLERDEFELDEDIQYLVLTPVWVHDHGQIRMTAFQFGL